MALSCLSIARIASKHRAVFMLDRSYRQLYLTRTSSSILSVQFKSTDAKSEKSDSEDSKSGKEIDIARENPYAGLTMGQKGKVKLNYQHLTVTSILNTNLLLA